VTSRTYLSIGDVLTLLREEFPDVTISKIRFLESQGLVNPERSPSGYRKFYDHDVERLRWVLRQQREHFLPLKVIRDRLAREGDAAMAECDAADSAGAAGADDAAGASGAVGAAGAGDVNGDRANGAAQPAQPAAVHEPAQVHEQAQPAPVHGPATVYSGRAHLAVVGGGTAATTSTAGAATVPAAVSASARQQQPPSGPRHAARSAGGSPAPAQPAGGSPGQPAQPAQPAASSARRQAPASSRQPSGAPSPTPPSGAAGPPPEVPTPADAAPEPTPSSDHAHGGTPAPAEPAPAGGTPVDGTPPAAAPAAPPAQPIPPTPPIPPASPASAVPLAAAVSGASLTAQELSAATGLSESDIASLEGFGLIEPMAVAGVLYYDEEALTVAKLVADFGRYGIEPRHLRLYRNAVDREMGLIEQIVTPLLRQRNPEARQRAVEAAADLSRLGQGLRASLLRREVRRQVGG